MTKEEKKKKFDLKFIQMNDKMIQKYRSKLTEKTLGEIVNPLQNMNLTQKIDYCEEVAAAVRFCDTIQELIQTSNQILALVLEGGSYVEQDDENDSECSLLSDYEEEVDFAKKSHEQVQFAKKDKRAYQKEMDQRDNLHYHFGDEDEQKEGPEGLYLDKFILPIEKEDSLIEAQMVKNGGPLGYIDNIYPCGIFPEKDLYELRFERITILYGGNGSGKSTLLNLIASRLDLDRMAPHNTAELYDSYVSACDYELFYHEKYPNVPVGSSMITSDDVFDFMLAIRSNNEEISVNKEEAKEDFGELKYGKSIKFKSLEDYDRLRLQILARKTTSSRRKFIRKTAGEEYQMNSNGETALQFFYYRIHSDTFYCLDEPENSLSPGLQLELVKMLERKAKEQNCQFVIATHSPFLLAMEGAKVYDLDAEPACVREWYELENTRMYYEFFKKHEALFQKD